MPHKEETENNPVLQKSVMSNPKRYIEVKSTYLEKHYTKCKLMECQVEFLKYPYV